MAWEPQAAIFEDRGLRLGDVVHERGQAGEGRERHAVDFAGEARLEVEPGDLAPQLGAFRGVTSSGVERAHGREVVLQHVVVVQFGLPEGAARLEFRQQPHEVAALVQFTQFGESGGRGERRHQVRWQGHQERLQAHREACL